MPMLFACITRLLKELEELHSNRKSPPEAIKSKSYEYINGWFKSYREDIKDSTTLLAIFSTLLPELRPDRTYFLKEDALAKVICRIMLLGSRQKMLTGWRRSTKEGDLASAVEVIVKATPPSSGGTVTVEEIDSMLDELAGRCQFSSEELREKSKGRTPDQIIGPIWQRLTWWEAKWLTRCILKNMAPVEISVTVALDAYHFLLPRLLTIMDDLPRACAQICSDEIKRDVPFRPRMDLRERYIEISNFLLRPEIGVKVGRGEFIKAQSCKHVASLAKMRTMAMERKYDGEYCQIHIDIRKGWSKSIKIFSKSGRDSTVDRKGIHDALRAALKIEVEKERWFKEMCIVEGELLVYNERKKQIMPFCHIRQHVTRAGRHIGTASDYAPDKDSHLMILLFDILLIDQESLLHTPYSERMRQLRKVLVAPKPGHCDLVQSSMIDFSRRDALEELQRHFANGILKRWEGFILKRCDSPYIDLANNKIDKTSRGHSFIGGEYAWIKLKKDYIEGLGDSADFCIVGGAADSSRTWARGLTEGSLSVFHAAVLVNKEDVKKHGSVPKLQVVFEVSYSITKEDLGWIQTRANHNAIEYKKNIQPKDYELEFTPELQSQIRKPTHIFNSPLIFEVVGGGFDKQTDCSFFTPRHPRVSKIHWDRGFTDSVSFSELQEMAEKAIYSQKANYSQEERLWIAKLERGDMGKQIDLTPRSNVSEVTPIRKHNTASLTPLSTPRGSGRSSTLSSFKTPSFSHRSETMPTPVTATRPRECPAPLTRRLTFATITETTPTKSFNMPLQEIKSNLRPLSTLTPTSPLVPPTSSLERLNPQKRKRTQEHVDISPSAYSQSRKRWKSSDDGDTSPLTDSNVFLMPSLSKFPQIHEQLSAHNVGMVRKLPLDKEGVLADDFQTEPGKRNIVIVETWAKALTIKVLRSLENHKKKQAEAGADVKGQWEIYDWRVCKTPSKKIKPNERISWDIWKVFDV